MSQVVMLAWRRWAWAARDRRRGAGRPRGSSRALAGSSAHSHHIRKSTNANSNRKMEGELPENKVLYVSRDFTYKYGFWNVERKKRICELIQIKVRRLTHPEDLKDYCWIALFLTCACHYRPGNRLQISQSNTVHPYTNGPTLSRGPTARLRARHQATDQPLCQDSAK